MAKIIEMPPSLELTRLVASNVRMKMILALLVSTTLVLSGRAADRVLARNWQVYFSPHGGCSEAVVEALGQAKSTVLVQAYSFTSAPIAMRERGRLRDAQELASLVIELGTQDGMVLSTQFAGVLQRRPSAQGAAIGLSSRSPIPRGFPGEHFRDFPSWF